MIPVSYISLAYGSEDRSLFFDIDYFFTRGCILLVRKRIFTKNNISIVIILILMEPVTNLLLSGKTTTKNAITLFDQLEPVDLTFMIGRWKGSEFRTGHRMDGLLEICGWYGKFFVNSETVHPLLFYTLDHQQLFAVNPDWIPMWLTFPKVKILKQIIYFSKLILQTKKAKAHLKMTEYRGKTSATMVYTSKPIQDHFKKIDENMVMGLMDLKGEPKPYFFILERDDSPKKIQLPINS